MGADMRDMSFEEQIAYIERHAAKIRSELFRADNGDNDSPATGESP